MITKEELKENLKNQIGIIEFTKKDGTLRKLRCSLSSEILPKTDFDPKNYTPKKTDNPNTLSVWDIEKEAWRSFRLDSLRDYSFEVI
jgi:hypothetical protein